MASEIRKFFAPEIVFGPQARLQAGRVAANLGLRRALVVTDPGVVKAGWAGHVVASLEAAGVSARVFSQVTPNPRSGEVELGARAFLEGACDGVVAVGGGSAMDCAKGVAILAANGGDIRAYAGVDAVHEPGPPLICVPTTAGSAADVSQFAIITDLDARNKIAIVSKAIVPDVCLADPETLQTVAPDLAAATGLDALTHAVEAYVSNAHSPLTDVHALKAASILGRTLPRLRGGLDDALRSEAMLACLEAGLAFSNASLGATHAMAHSLGGLLDLPHGLCNALLLPAVCAFNCPAAAPRFAELLEALGRGHAGPGLERELPRAMRGLAAEAGISGGLAALGVRRGDLPGLARLAAADACLVTNPRDAGAADLEALYAESL